VSQAQPSRPDRAKRKRRMVVPKARLELATPRL
jgi:hypothetical protein